MALVKVTVEKLVPGEKIYARHDDDMYLYDIDATTAPIQKETVSRGWYDELVNAVMTSANYFLEFDVIVQEFNGEKLSGVAWDVDEIGLDDALAISENKQFYVDLAIKGVEELCAKRKELVPDKWTYSFFTAWGFWNDTIDTEIGREYDCGCEYLGTVDLEEFPLEVVEDE